MAVQYVDVSSTTEREGVSLTASGTVTNSVRVHYDDTKSTNEILLAIKRAMEAIQRIRNA
jgi:hypothetical protein